MVVGTFPTLQFLSGAAEAGSSINQSARGSAALGQKPFLNPHANAAPAGTFNARRLSGTFTTHSVSAQTVDLEARSAARGARLHVPDFLPVSVTLYGCESSVDVSGKVHAQHDRHECMWRCLVHARLVAILGQA